MRQQLQLANANIKELQEKLEDSELELDREVTDEMSKEIRSLKNQLQKATKSSKYIDELKCQFSKEKDEQESELLRLHAEINEKEEHIELLKALNNEQEASLSALKEIQQAETPKRILHKRRKHKVPQKKRKHPHPKKMLWRHLHLWVPETNWDTTLHHLQQIEQMRIQSSII